MQFKTCLIPYLPQSTVKLSPECQYHALLSCNANMETQKIAKVGHVAFQLRSIIQYDNLSQFHISVPFPYLLMPLVVRYLSTTFSFSTFSLLASANLWGILLVHPPLSEDISPHVSSYIRPIQTKSESNQCFGDTKFYFIILFKQSLDK